MQREGPQLEVLLRRLAECPADFLDEPRIGQSGSINVAAVLSDLLRDLGGQPLAPGVLAEFRPPLGPRRPHRNYLRLVLVALWLFHDPWFRAEGRHAEAVLAFLRQQVTILQESIQADLVVLDPVRREELIRLGLRSLGLRPQGESIAQAEDRLASIDSVLMVRVRKEALEAEERAAKIREALASQQAQEATATYGGG